MIFVVTGLALVRSSRCLPKLIRFYIKKKRKKKTACAGIPPTPSPVRFIIILKYGVGKILDYRHKSLDNR